MTRYSRILRVLPLATFAIASLAAVPSVPQDVEAQPKIVTHMKAINGGLRTMRRSFQDPARKQENLDRLDEIREHAAAAREEQPLKTAELPEEEREKFLEGFRKEMDVLLKDIDDLKTAIAADNAEEAERLIRKIYDARSEAHKIYQKEID